MKCSSEGDITLHCSNDLQAAPPLMGPVHLNMATGCKNKQTHTYPPVPLLQSIPEPEDTFTGQGPVPLAGSALGIQPKTITDPSNSNPLPLSPHLPPGHWMLRSWCTQRLTGLCQPRGTSPNGSTARDSLQQPDPASYSKSMKLPCLDKPLPLK